MPSYLAMRGTTNCACHVSVHNQSVIKFLVWISEKAKSNSVEDGCYQGLNTGGL